METESEAKAGTMRTKIVEKVEAKVEAEAVIETKAEVKMEPALPSKIKLTRMWGFIDEAGERHLWNAGQMVDVAEEIKMIIVDCKFDAYEVIE